MESTPDASERFCGAPRAASSESDGGSFHFALEQVQQKQAAFLDDLFFLTAAKRFRKVVPARGQSGTGTRDEPQGVRPTKARLRHGHPVNSIEAWFDVDLGVKLCQGLAVAVVGSQGISWVVQAVLREAHGRPSAGHVGQDNVFVGDDRDYVCGKRRAALSRADDDIWKDGE